MNTAEHDRAVARRHGVAIVDYRRPRKGEEYIYRGGIVEALTDHMPGEDPRPIIAREARVTTRPLVNEAYEACQWYRTPGEFRLGDLVRIKRVNFNPALEGVVGQVVRMNDQGNGQLEVVYPWTSDKKASAFLWPRELELIAGAVQEDGGPDEDELDRLGVDPEDVLEVDEVPIGEAARWAMENARHDWSFDDTKPTNPKDAIGSDKLPLHLWPTTATVFGSLGLLDGMLKYGRSNWRDAGVKFSIYYDAQRRHMDAAFEGEDIDPESGLPHLAHALACIAIIIDAQATGNLVDDRQYNGDGYRALVEELTPHVKRLKERHDGRSPKHFTIADNGLAGPSGPL